MEKRPADATTSTQRLFFLFSTHNKTTNTKDDLPVKGMGGFRKS